MKKALKIVGYILAAFVLMIVGGIIFSDSDGPGTETSAPKVEEASAPVKEEPVAKEEPAQEESKEKPKEEPKQEDNVFSFGTDVAFESGMTIKAVDVSKTSERNEFADPTKYVLVVTLELTNTTAAEMAITAHDLNIQDKSGFQGKTYPGGDQMVEVAPNGKARVKFQYATDGEGPYKVLASDAVWEK
jgi:hypothetical protein